MKKIHFLSLLFFISGTQLKAQTTSLPIPAIFDNTIYADFPSNSNGAGQDLFVGNNSISSPRRALVLFPINIAVPLRTAAGGIPINSAVLSLTINTPGVLENLTLYKVTSAWGQGASDAAAQENNGIPAMFNDASWNCRFSNGTGGCNTSWTTPGSDHIATASATAAVGPGQGTYTFSSPQLLADVQSWVDNPATNFGWVLIGDETASATINRFASRENVTIASRPLLTITYTLLPVKLINFKAAAGKVGTLLSWQTAEEANNAFFSIEHSLDAVHFTSLGRVAGAGTSSSLHSYSFIDGDVKSGTTYYRLTQTDFDGKVNYSSIVSVNNKQDTHNIFISPNPAGAQIILSGTGAETGNTYSVIDYTGAVVLSGKTTSGTPVNISNLPKGSYYIRIQTKTNELLKGQFIKL